MVIYIIYIYIVYIINIQKIMLNPATKMGFPTQISPGSKNASGSPAERTSTTWVPGVWICFHNDGETRGVHGFLMGFR